jgi:hypothetical protein
VCSTALGDREATESAEGAGQGSGRVGFATGSQHGWSSEEPAAGSCCGTAPRPVAASSPSCGG